MQAPIPDAPQSSTAAVAAPIHDPLFPYSAGDVVEMFLEQGRVPSRYRSARFATFDPRPGTTVALEAAQRLAGRPGEQCGTLILTGPPGTGKTYLAASVLAARAEHALRDLIEERDAGGFDFVRALDHRLRIFRSRFASVPRLLDTLRRSIRADDDDEDPLEELEAAPILVLDDIGVEKSSDWTVDRLTTLVGNRYDEELATIVTSNYTPDELANRGYDRLVSRLLEDGPHVRINASDYRLRVQQ